LYACHTQLVDVLLLYVAPTARINIFTSWSRQCVKMFNTPILRHAWL